MFSVQATSDVGLLDDVQGPDFYDEDDQTSAPSAPPSEDGRVDRSTQDGGQSTSTPVRTEGDGTRVCNQLDEIFTSFRPRRPLTMSGRY